MPWILEKPQTSKNTRHQQSSKPCSFFFLQIHAVNIRDYPEDGTRNRSQAQDHSNLPSIQSLYWLYRLYDTVGRMYELDELDVSSKVSSHISWQALSIVSSTKASAGSRDLHSNHGNQKMQRHVESFSPTGAPAPICSIHAVHTLSYQHNRLVSDLKSAAIEKL